MAVIGSLTRAYAKAIYLDGTKKFSDIRPEYAEPVKDYAAATYTLEEITAARDAGRITEQEYADTVAKIPAAQ